MVATLNLDPWQKVRQPHFSHFRPFLEENIFWPKTLLPPLPPLYLPKEGIMVPKNQPWCQHGANHGANHGAMVPTNFLAISDHFWKKTFFGKKFPPSPPPVPLWHKDRGDGGDGGERGGMVIVSEKWSEQVSRHFRSFPEEKKSERKFLTPPPPSRGRGGVI